MIRSFLLRLQDKFERVDSDAQVLAKSSHELIGVPQCC